MLMCVFAYIYDICGKSLLYVEWRWEAFWDFKHVWTLLYSNIEKSIHLLKTFVSNTCLFNQLNISFYLLLFFPFFCCICTYNVLSLLSFSIVFFCLFRFIDLRWMRWILWHCDDITKYALRALTFNMKL